jgi:hypothetical protein
MKRGTISLVTGMNEAGTTIRFTLNLILFLFLLPTAGLTQETPHLAFVSEYVRQLGANENVRELSEREVVAEKDNNNRLMASIRASTTHGTRFTNSYPE